MSESIHLVEVNEVVYANICTLMQAALPKVSICGVILRRSWSSQRVLAIRAIHADKGVNGVYAGNTLINCCSPFDWDPLHLGTSIWPRVVGTGCCERLREGFA